LCCWIALCIASCFGWHLRCFSRSVINDKTVSIESHKSMACTDVISMNIFSYFIVLILTFPFLRKIVTSSCIFFPFQNVIIK
jgi:hypothetical protein